MVIIDRFVLYDSEFDGIKSKWHIYKKYLFHFCIKFRNLLICFYDMISFKRFWNFPCFPCGIFRIFRTDTQADDDSGGNQRS